MDTQSTFVFALTATAFNFSVSHLNIKHHNMSASKLSRQAIQNSWFNETKSTLPRLVPCKLPSHPHKLELSYPPKQRYTHNYGFWLSPEWLIDLGKHIRLIEDCVEPPDHTEFWMRGIGYIRWALDIDPLTAENCFLTIEHCVQPETNGAPIECVDSDGEVVVLSVCSDNETDIRVIPYQEQVDYLSNLLGRKPQWWVNICLPRNAWE
ncbi:uncharacterized protein EDB91DRAFT_1290964 [Suillus paluster]|uniref:uncharacterized protein n=1 Tax=Suillus paluster TaxID=48578 RepID=UPI001B879D36|nr:uncharacterized protein EDB91DRAFT_1290964 [Suillus paluster]KAG1737073.1 hypothetical protein EDB91DRAFT_1290964 [Suillus paluster]